MNFAASPIARDLATTLAEVARYYPVVAVTGPRQSGKTTLCRALFSQKPYVSLEALDDRQFALEDPRGFLRQYPDGAILDEVQRAPQLLSYLQGEVDAHPRPGCFVLTGSQQIDLHAQVSQSLAGQVGPLDLGGSLAHLAGHAPPQETTASRSALAPRRQRMHGAKSASWRSVMGKQSERHPAYRPPKPSSDASC